MLGLGFSLLAASGGYSPVVRRGILVVVASLGVAPLRRSTASELLGLQ